MRIAQNGFYYPEINKDICVNCGLCQQTCPEYEILNGITENQQLYSAYSKDEIARMNGSSGGIFFEIAKFWIKKYGTDAKVYGAAFDESLILKHIGVSEVKQLPPLLKSKYVECDTNHVFLLIKNELRLKKNILFCGTPCQCAALRKFLKKIDTSNLLIIDFLCHGVPSQDLFSKSIRDLERKLKIKIINFKFRTKPLKRYKNEDHYYSYTYIKKGEIHSIEGLPNWKFPYYSGYCRYNSFRSSCYECRYARPDRIGDITLGDFWKLNTISAIEDFQKGYSMVFTNTEKGKRIFEDLSSELIIEKFPLEVAVALNPTYTKGAVKTEQNQQSIKDLEILSYSRYKKKYLIVKKDLISKAIRFIKRKINR